MITIAWSKLAGEDRDHAFADAFRLGVDDAEKLLDMLEQSEQFLLRTPYAGTPLFEGIRRKWRLGRLPYALVYRIDGDRLFILRLIHLRTDWQNIT